MYIDRDKNKYDLLETSNSKSNMFREIREVALINEIIQRKPKKKDWMTHEKMM